MTANSSVVVPSWIASWPARWAVDAKLYTIYLCCAYDAKRNITGNHKSYKSSLGVSFNFVRLAFLSQRIIVERQ